MVYMTFVCDLKPKIFYLYNITLINSDVRICNTNIHRKRKDVEICMHMNRSIMCMYTYVCINMS